MLIWHSSRDVTRFCKLFEGIAARVPENTFCTGRPARESVKARATPPGVSTTCTGLSKFGPLKRLCGTSIAMQVGSSHVRKDCDETFDSLRSVCVVVVC